MSKKIVLLITLLLLTLSLSACSKGTEVIDVIIKDNEDHLNYLTVLDNGKDKTIEKFNSDGFSKYTVDCTKIESEIKYNRIYNKVNDAKIYDKDGNVADDPVMNGLLLKAVEKIHHPIFYFDIYELEGRYFAFIELNVNWQDPCYLYEYDADTDKLKEWIVWQDVDLVGLHLIENGISK